MSPDARRADAPAARERSAGNDKPTGLDHAGLDAGGARLRRARVGSLWERRPPELPGADAVYQFPTGSDLELTHATQEGITLRVLLSRLLNCQPMRVSKKYSGEAWGTHGKRPYTPARYEAVPSQPDAAELGRLEGAFHRSLRPGAQLTTSLLGTSGLPTPVGACVEINQ